MKIHILFGFLCFFYFGLAIGEPLPTPSDKTTPASSPVDAISDETKLLKMIKEEPTSEQHRYDYAMFLYGKKRFLEARSQLGMLFALNSNHKAGRRLNINIQDIEGIKDQKKQSEFMAEFLEKEPKGLQPKPMTSQEIKARQAKLDQKYQIKQNLAGGYKASEEEKNLGITVSKYRQANRNEDAEILYRNRIKKYPNSPEAMTDFIVFLVDRGRLEQAEVQLKEAIKHFPGDTKLLILSDEFKEFRAAKSIEQKAAAKQNMETALLDYEAIAKENAN